MDSTTGSSSFCHIPTLMNSTLGRSQEIEAACALLQRHEIHVLTLTGPGGVGKTRLATEIAHGLVTVFTDGIFFVSLAPLRSPALVLPAIAQALSLADTGQQTLTELLHAYLRDKHLLLVLDNFEHLLEAGPQVAAILTVAPRLKLLVTSRAALHLYGEHEFEVLPLPLPDLKRIVSATSTAWSAPAIALFVQRAQAVKPSFTLTAENMQAVAEICIQLDGLPLAIELAAARSKLLSPHELLARLQPRLRLLTGGARDLPARQQTLRNTLDWSYQLLTEDEQRFFCRLGIFVGPWTREAACAVAPPLVIPLVNAFERSPIDETWHKARPVTDQRCQSIESQVNPCYQ